jgi:uncharacterized protein YjiS (DUF1127 family)
MTTIAEAKARTKSSYWAPVGAVAARAAMRVLAWHERARQRQFLLMNDHALRDIGKSRDDIASSLPRALWTMGESDQPCWRATINSRGWL